MEKRILQITCLILFVLLITGTCTTGKEKIKPENRLAFPAGRKPSPDDVIKILKEGNERFIAGKSLHPHMDAKRIAMAGTESQNDYAYATIITCSDSRVPVELIFDAGVMDIFVIRVAGNVCDIDEVGSIEYGLAPEKSGNGSGQGH